MSLEFHIGQIVQLEFCADGLCNEQPLSPLQLFPRRAGALATARLDVSSYTRLPVSPVAAVGDAGVDVGVCTYGYIVDGIGDGDGAEGVLAAKGVF